MRKSGVIYKRVHKKRKISIKRESSPSLPLFVIIPVILIAFLFLNQNKTIGSEKTGKTNVLSSLFKAAASPTLSPTPTSPPTPTPTPVILPSRLIIEKLGVESIIEYVGVEGESMGNPSNWENVAWFSHGAPPGMPGNAVIAGHFDTNRGTPAVFYNLGNLETGDIIKVLSVNGDIFSFTVTGKEIYPYDDAPTDFIFKSKGPIPKLILITCEGKFQRSINTYSHRIVIYSELI